MQRSDGSTSPSPSLGDTRVFILGSSRLDSRTGVLHAEDGSQTRPRRKLCHLLQLLAEHPGRVLTRAELMDRLWPKLTASEESLTQLVREARVALHDKDGVMLQTVHGRGYLFNAPAPCPIARSISPATSFVGREGQLEELCQWMEQHRLITLTGPGGVGKTRLMAELAATCSPWDRTDQVWLDLSPMVDPAELPILLTNLIGIGNAGDSAIEVLLGALRDRECLLLIDNAEQWIAQLNVLLRRILAECPRMRVLVTSRLSLSITEERVFRLAPLAVPPPDVGTMAEALCHGAVRLLVNRAVAQVPGFDPAAQDPQVLTAICQRLDGLALAIEMAASMLPLLTPTQLLERLRRRLHLQAPDTGSAPARQRSLSAMLNWSWELLAAPEQKLLQVIAVFPGSAPLDLLAEVAGVEDWRALDGVAALVRASLAVPVSSVAEPRFTMLETTRAFALERAGPGAEALRRAHLCAVLGRMQSADRDWPTTASAEWRRRHDMDAANLRAALHWAFGQDGETELAIRLAGVSQSFWLDLDELPLREARRWLARAAKLAGPATPPDVLARLNLGLSWPDDQLGDLATLPLALQAAEQFRSLGDWISTGAALWRAGCAVLVVETIDQAGSYLAEAEGVLRLGPPTKWLVLTLVRQASVQVLTRHDELALATYKEALSLARALEYPYGAMLCGHSMGDHLFAMNRQEESLSLLTALRDELPRGQRSQLVSNLATQLAAVNRTQEAIEAVSEILDATAITGLSATLARGLETLAMLVAEQGDLHAAALLFGYVLTVHPARRQRRGGRKEVHRRLVEALQAERLSGLLEGILVEGAALSQAQITELAKATLSRLK